MRPYQFKVKFEVGGEEVVASAEGATVEDDDDAMAEAVIDEVLDGDEGLGRDDDAIQCCCEIHILDVIFCDTVFTGTFDISFSDAFKSPLLVLFGIPNLPQIE